MKTLPIECIEPNLDYALTVNLAGAELYNLRETYIDYITFFIKKFNYCTFRVYPELSPTGRLHYHGYIRFRTETDIILFYSETLRLLQKDHIADISICELGAFGDLTWYYYCRKQKWLLKSFFLKSKLAYKLRSSRLNPAQAKPRSLRDQILEGAGLDYSAIEGAKIKNPLDYM